MVKALLVSGDRESISMVSQTIQDYCHDITFLGVADTIQAGVSMINSTQPDLLILDTKLTDGSGFEMLKHFEASSFKILVLSSHIEYALMAFKYCAVDFLLKPADPDDLIQAINKASEFIPTK